MCFIFPVCFVTNCPIKINNEFAESKQKYVLSISIQTHQTKCLYADDGVAFPFYVQILFTILLLI